jgi:hypothetical protein
MQSIARAEGLATPVALFIFNRPAETARVFQAIRRARPRQLFVIADGPRPHCPDDVAGVAAARSVVEAVDWPCELRCNYAGANQGLADRVASGISWVFEQVETAIVLEDDCLPHPSFFPFCEQLLARYADDERVMMVGGVSLEPYRRLDTSYSFSHYMLVWGWATWRRAWRLYDHEMRLWPAARDGGWLADVLGSEAEAHFWTPHLDDVYAGRENYWGRRWLLACWLQRGLVIQPAVNLVTNIGHGAAATHTTVASPFADLPTAPMSFPLRHPPFVVRDARADAELFRRFFRRSLLQRAGYRLRLLIRRHAPGGPAS